MAIVSLKPNQDINVDAGANWQRTSSPGSYNSYWELLSNGVISAGEYAYPGWPPPADGLILGLTTFAFPIGSVINSVRIRTQYNSQSGGSLMAYLRSGATR